MESCMEWVSAERIKEWIVSAKECFEKIEWIPGMEWEVSGIGWGVAGSASSAPTSATAEPLLP